MTTAVVSSPVHLPIRPQGHLSDKATRRAKQQNWKYSVFYTDIHKSKQWLFPRVSREFVVNDNGIRPGRGSQDDTLVHTPYLKLENRDWLPCGTGAWMACILLELEGAWEFPGPVLHFTSEVSIIQENEGTCLRTHRESDSSVSVWYPWSWLPECSLFFPYSP